MEASPPSPEQPAPERGRRKAGKQAISAAHQQQEAPRKSRDRKDDWRHYAECLDEDPELFFPIGNTGSSLLQIEEAKLVCGRCDVKAECLKTALDLGALGIWGGLTEDERTALKRRTTRANRKT